MRPAEIIETITQSFDGIIPKSSGGETSLFYNPNQQLPNGVYFCTIKEQDGANDIASDLARAGIYRLSIGLPPARYATLFGDKPTRPAKGGIVATGHDFTACDVLMPHPIYAWMSWVCINAPSAAQFESLLPLIGEAHAAAVTKFNKKLPRA